MKLLMCALAATLFLTGQTVAEDATKCPWKLVTGHWRLTDSTGTADVVWKSAGDGQALIGAWEGKDGRATELVGWRPDQKVLVATGYGSNGSYWEIKFTTVTEAMIKGEMVNREPDGTVLKGTWQVTRKNDDEMPTLFVGTRDGEKVTVKGSFKRVK